MVKPFACDPAGRGCKLLVVPRVTGNVSKRETKGWVRMQECDGCFIFIVMDAAAFELIHLIEA